MKNYLLAKENSFTGSATELKKINDSLQITLLLGSLTSGDRQKIMTICTIDVHSRDVVGKLISNKIESALAFMWQSQLRHRSFIWTNYCPTKKLDCFIMKNLNKTS